MTEILTQFHFIRPLWLIGIIPVCLLLILNSKFKRASSNWTQLIDAQFLSVLAKGTEAKRSWFEPLCLALFSVLALIALAGPSWSKIEVPITKNESATVILWDLSPSMLVDDIKPSRIICVSSNFKDIFCFFFVFDREASRVFRFF